MSSGFLEGLVHTDSPVGRRDPRAKLALFFGAALIVASEPPGSIRPFAFYFGLILTLALASKASVALLGKRWLAATPFVLLAAAMPLVASWGGEVALDPLPWSVSIVLRASAAIVLISLLTATTSASRLLWAAERLHAPEALRVTTTLMLRYLFLLYEEVQRVAKARRCRAPHGLRLRAWEFYSKQFALIFIRAWEQAERVQGAMLSRGFDGSLPLRSAPRLGPLDWIFAGLGLAAFLAVRSAL